MDQEKVASKMDQEKVASKLVQEKSKEENGLNKKVASKITKMDQEKK